VAVRRAPITVVTCGSSSSLIFVSGLPTAVPFRQQLRHSNLSRPKSAASAPAQTDVRAQLPIKRAIVTTPMILSRSIEPVRARLPTLTGADVGGAGIRGVAHQPPGTECRAPASWGGWDPTPSRAARRPHTRRRSLSV
jgi:hypothetical protein